MVAQKLTVYSVEATHVAAIDALYASINPFVLQGSHLNQVLLKATNLVASIQFHPPGLRRAYFGSLAKAFDRIREAKQGGYIDLDLESLESTMLNAELDIEALRLLRAEAIVAIGRCSPTMASKTRTRVEALTEKENSKNVRDLLSSALAPAPPSDG